MLKKMNLPNKLTMLRMVLVPVFIVFMALPIEWEWNIWVSLGIYVVASITDCLDGQISRRKNLVTKFGKIMDPLADKLLVSSGFVMLTGLGVIPAWMTAIIIFRDFFVSSLRVFGSDNGKDVGAGLSGKVKTIFQLVGIILAIVGLGISPFTYEFGSFVENANIMSTGVLLVNVGMTVSIAAAVLTTVWSLVDYFIRFKDDINVEE